VVTIDKEEAHRGPHGEVQLVASVRFDHQPWTWLRASLSIMGEVKIPIRIINQPAESLPGKNCLKKRLRALLGSGWLIYIRTKLSPIGRLYTALQRLPLSPSADLSSSFSTQ